jgi:hypothetical protein
MTAELMQQLVGAHSAAETRMDLDATMATLVDHPARLRLEGYDDVATFYQEHFDSFFPLLDSHVPINECWGDASACLEFDVRLKPPNDVAPYRINVVLSRDGDRLIGERFYTSLELVKLMTGTAFGLLKPF